MIKVMILATKVGLTLKAWNVGWVLVASMREGDGMDGLRPYMADGLWRRRSLGYLPPKVSLVGRGGRADEWDGHGPGALLHTRPQGAA